jgi:predicted DNA-binding transcriptional regulator AlpA
MDGQGTPLTLSNREFAALAGISVSRFYELRADKTIPDNLLSPIPGRWARDRVEAWLTNHGGVRQRRPRRQRSAA